MGERLPLMEFKDGKSFFDMMCQYGGTELKVGMGVVGIVVDARKEYGQNVVAKLEDDGTQVAMIKVASRKGGFDVPAKTPGKGDMLEAGDIVVWVPMKYDAKFAKNSGSKDFGWIGLIMAKIAPTMDPNPDGQYTFICDYSGRPS